MMEPEYINSAKDRAQQVVDGMARVKDQQARDVLKLVDAVELRDQAIRRLENKITELTKKKDTNEYGNIFRDVFK